MTTADQIIDAAFDAFYRNGFHATGVDQLSQVAGVTKRTLYRHFPSKEALIDAALQRRDDRFMDKLRAFVDAAAVSERPRAYVEYLLAWGHEADFHGCAFINAAAEYAGADEPPHVQARRHKQRVLDYLAETCRAAGLDDSVAPQLFVLGEGVIVTLQVMGSNAAAITAARALADSLLSPAAPGEEAATAR